MKISLWRAALTAVFVFSVGCANAPKQAPVQPVEQAASEHHHDDHGMQARDTASSVDGIDESREASYVHGGKFNYNPQVSPVTPAADVDQNLVQNHQQKVFNNETPNLVVTKKQNYHYQPNVDDIVARHTFVLMDAAKTLGHHVAFFQSRHQHHVVLKLKYDFSGAGLSAADRRSVQAGAAVFQNVMLKTKPKTGFFAVQVAPGTSFELMTIATGNTRKFKGIFTDGIIGLTQGASRLTKSMFDVVVEVEAIHHFNRMYVSETANDLQYMVFKEGSAPNSYLLVHLINGKVKNVVTRQEQDLNLEQALIATSDNVSIKDGTIVRITNRTPLQFLAPADQVSTAVLRSGFEESSVENGSNLNFEVKSQIYRRAIGFDSSQQGARDAFLNGN